MHYPSLTKNLHHEVELVVAIGTGGRDITAADALQHVWGYAVGLDMTRRDLQGEAKKQGRPWCIGKGFDESAPIGADPRRRRSAASAPTRAITLEVNGTPRQKSTLGKLIWSVAEIIEHLSAAWALQPGDLIFTGTPEGVAAVVPGDTLDARIEGVGTLQVRVAAERDGARRMKLYNYFRSSASYRVRIALALKGLDYDYMPVHLARNEQFKPSRTRRCRPSRLVPLLEDGDALADAVAGDHRVPRRDASAAAAAAGRRRSARARVRALALDIACEIHPLNNLRVLRYLVRDLKVSEDDKNRWYRHWVETGLEAVERQLARTRPPARFCHGDTPTLADCVLVPQIFNAQRFDCRLDARADRDARLRGLHGARRLREDAAVGLPGRGLTMAQRAAPRLAAARLGRAAASAR